MKRFWAILTLMLSLNYACLANFSTLNYSLENLGDSKWQYHYQLSNINLEQPIKEFTIWFDSSLYDNIEVASQNNQWDFIKLLNVPNLGLGLDGLALDTGISQGQVSQSFSVSFDWIGQDLPTSQSFEVVDSDTYNVLDSGVSIAVPEPTSLAVFSIAGLILRRRLSK